ncbi:hypothetical protein C8J57DRAFT_1730558 [Mycena rebaudengoi]|nr:hypothetical protein C8J57DRAFT_1730558 [Mycena rebaudengoi]
MSTSTAAPATATGIDDTSKCVPTLSRPLTHPNCPPPRAHLPRRNRAARIFGCVTDTAAPCAYSHKVNAQSPATQPRRAQRALFAPHMRLKTLESARTEDDVRLTTLLSTAAHGIFVCFLCHRHRRAPLSTSTPCNLLQNYVTALRTPDTALRTELLALNSALWSSKTAFATTQDDPSNLRCALAREEGNEIWVLRRFEEGGGASGENVQGSYAGTQRAASDAERAQRDAGRAASAAENTSWIVEHAKWDADCEIMRAEMMRGKEERRVLHARSFCPVRPGFGGEVTSTGSLSTPTHYYSTYTSRRGRVDALPVWQIGEPVRERRTGGCLPPSPTRAALFAEIKHLTANALDGHICRRSPPLLRHASNTRYTTALGACRTCCRARRAPSAQIRALLAQAAARLSAQMNGQTPIMLAMVANSGRQREGKGGKGSGGGGE